jgi:hypothetical protein
MKTETRKQGLVWGGLLILFGSVGLIDNYMDLSVWAWVIILALGGAGVFAVYLTERSEWGLLIPTYVMWVVAVLVAFIELDMLRDAFVAPFVLTAVALPFFVAFLRNRQQWGFLIPAYVLWAVGLMVWLRDQGVLSDRLVPSYVMFTIAIPFFAVYSRHPRQWWPLIPGSILTVIGLAFLIAESMLPYIVPIILILVGIGVLLHQANQPDASIKPPK